MDLSISSVVTASSTNPDGVCPSNLCNPQAVIDGRTQQSGNGTRWMSEPEYLTSSGSCRPQWLDFKFASLTPTPLTTSSILYGDYGSWFQGNSPACPHLSIENTVSSGYILLTAGQDYNCVIGTTTDGNTTSRQDTITFIQTSNIIKSSLTNLRMTWNIVPYGHFGSTECVMDVEEVYIQAVSATTTTGTTTAATTTPATTPGTSGADNNNSNNNTASAPSNGAVAGIVLACVALSVVGALFAARFHNIRKRKRQAEILLKRRQAVPTSD